MTNCPICTEECEPTGCVCGWTGDKALLTEVRPDPFKTWEREVKSEAYYRALEDGRVLMWRPIASRPNDRMVIVGWVSNMVGRDRWFMMQAGPADVTNLATHWREDSIGTPYVAPARDYLPRMGG